MPSDLVEETVNYHVDGNYHRREQEEESAELNEKSKNAYISSRQADQRDDVARERENLKSAENAWEKRMKNELRKSAKYLVMGFGSDLERQQARNVEVALNGTRISPKASSVSRETHRNTPDMKNMDDCWKVLNLNEKHQITASLIFRL